MQMEFCCLEVPQSVDVPNVSLETKANPGVSFDS